MTKKIINFVVTLALFGWILNAHFGAFDAITEIFHRVGEEMDVKLEMDLVAKIVRRYYEKTGELPVRNFQKAIRDDLKKQYIKVTPKTGKDVWGTHFRLAPRLSDNGFYIRSAGPDRKWKSQDDVAAFFPLEEKKGKRRSTSKTSSRKSGTTRGK